MTYREATQSDTPAILEMACDFLRQSVYGGAIPTNRDQLTTLIEYVLTHGVVYVADVQGSLVGFIALVVVTHPMSGQWIAEELAWWVEPGARGGSVGPQLWAIAEDWARSQNVAMLKMVAPLGSRLSAPLTRAGYVAIETHFVKVF